MCVYVCERGEGVCDWERMCECVSVRVWLREWVSVYMKDRERECVCDFYVGTSSLLLLLLLRNAKENFDFLPWWFVLLLLEVHGEFVFFCCRCWKCGDENSPEITKSRQKLHKTDSWSKKRLFFGLKCRQKKEFEVNKFFVSKKSAAIFRSLLIRDEGCPTKVGLLESSMMRLTSNKAWQGSPTTLRQERKKCRELALKSPILSHFVKNKTKK